MSTIAHNNRRLLVLPSRTQQQEPTVLVLLCVDHVNRNGRPYTRRVSAFFSREEWKKFTASVEREFNSLQKEDT